MKPDFNQPFPDPEARVTALLLGELSPEEAGEVRRLIAADPQLAVLHDHLRQTMELLREAAIQPASEAVAPPAMPRLSAERRETLQAAFKTVQAPVAAKRSPATWRSWLPLAAAASLVLLIVSGMLLPSLAKAKAKSQHIAQLSRERQRQLEERVEEQVRAVDPLGRQIEEARGSRGAGATGVRVSAKELAKGRGEVAGRSAGGAEALGLRPAADANRDRPQDPGVAAVSGGRVVNLAARTETDASDSAKPMMDVRMMMRYGLMPKGVQVDQEGKVVPTAGGPSGQPAKAPAPAGTLKNWFFTATNRAQPETHLFDGESALGEAGRGGATPLFANSGQGTFGAAAPAAGEGGGAASAPAVAGYFDQAIPRSDQMGRHGVQTRGPVKAALAPNEASQSEMTADFGSVAPVPEAPAVVVLAPTPSFAFSLPVTAPAANAPAPVLGDKPALGRAFDKSVTDGNRVTSFQGGELKQELARTEMAPLPLKLPVPAFMGMPADIPLGGAEKAKLSELAAKSLPAPAPAPALDAKAGKPVEPALRGLALAKEVSVPTRGKASQPTTDDSLGEKLEALNREAAPTSPRLHAQFDEAKDLSQEKTRAGLVERNSVVSTAGESVAAESHGFMTDASNQKVDESALELRASLVKTQDSIPAKKVADGFAGSNGVVASAGVPVLATVEQELERVPAQRPAPEPQPEIATSANAFSTFSLNVADVSYKLAAATIESGALPEPASIRTEEFINAFDYRDPAPAAGRPIAFAWERAQDPFAHNRDLLRFSVQTAALGREAGRPLNLVLVLDSSGSMERADRVSIIREALQVLAGQLAPQDRISVVAFARTARLWVDGLPGSRAGELVSQVGHLTPEGGTNLEDALKLGYETARRHFLANGANRVILLTDGAANLGDVSAVSLDRMVQGNRQRGIALDCFGIGWDGLNDELLEQLARHGDGRYGFVNSPAEAATGFASQLAGALQIAAADVKVQVEFNAARVTAWRQIGYARHQLTKEQFRDNTVDAAEIGAAESGNALYVVEVNPQGQGPLGVARVRYRVPETGRYEEHEWTLAYNGAAVPLAQSSAAMRLAACAAYFGDWLASSPFAADAVPARLLPLLSGVAQAAEPDPRPRQLEWMIRQAQTIRGQ